MIDRPHPRATHRAGNPGALSGVQSAPRCTNGSPARQRSRKRPIGGCRWSSAELGAPHDAHVAHGRVARRQEQRRVGQRDRRRSRARRGGASRRAAARSTRRARRARRPGRPRRPHSSASSRRSACSIVSPASTPPPGQQPVGAPGLLVPHEHERVAAVQEPADAQSRRLVAHVAAARPEALLAARARRRARRARSTATCGSATTTSWAMRMPGSTWNGLAAIGVEQRHAQLAAVAAVDEARAS